MGCIDCNVIITHFHLCHATKQKCSRTEAQQNRDTTDQEHINIAKSAVPCQPGLLDQDHSPAILKMRVTFVTLLGVAPVLPRCFVAGELLVVALSGNLPILSTSCYKDVDIAFGSTTKLNCHQCQVVTTT